MNHIGNALNQDEARNVAKATSRSGRQVQKIILTQRTYFHKISVFEVRNVGLVVRPNKLFRTFQLKFWVDREE